MHRILCSVAALATVTLSAQVRPQPDWAGVEEETLRHFQALVRLDTTDPPGGERPAAEYLKQVLEQLRKVINDPSVEATWIARDVRPGTGSARLDLEASPSRKLC